MKRKKIAIIGSGISGLTCAYYLHKDHDITVYEASDYIGGHTHTVDVEHAGEKARIDTGFIVFNDRTYPNFIKLMDELGVVYQKTEMSFSVRNDTKNLEYNGHTLFSLFSQRINLLRPSFYHMLRDIVRFNKEVRRQKDADKTIGEYLAANTYSDLFRENYLMPMISAIWSMGLESCKDFPLGFFTRFFENHGLLDIVNRPQWYTIKGGSSNYIAPLTRGFAQNIRLATQVKKVERKEGKVVVTTQSDAFEYDEAVMACHSDQALALLSQPSMEEISVLQDLRFSDNKVILHTDTSILPKYKRSWASWNYRMIDAGKETATVTYNMNILQRLASKNTYLVTLNQPIDDAFVLGAYNYSHPVYSTAAIQAQKRWQDISGKDKIHYCGAYWLNGFHEDGVSSGLRVVKALGG